MKTKTIILIILSKLFLFSIIAQSPKQNLDKYWNYRNRLKSKFLVNQYQWRTPVIGRNYGLNMPACAYNPTVYSSDVQTTAKTIKWADATSYLGYYIAVLATEYKLLKNSGQDVEPTIAELFDALLTIERLDWHAEGLYGCGCPDISQSGGANFYNCYCSQYGTCLNGFIIRDDVPFDFTNYWANHGYPNFAGLNVLSDYIGDYQTGEHSDEMSQDQVWNLMVGLSLVKKLVDYPGLMWDGDGEHITYVKCAQKITDRLLKYMQNKTQLFGDVYLGAWVIYNPCTGLETDRGGKFGDLLANAYLFAEAGNWITDMQFGNYHYGYEPSFSVPLPFGYPNNKFYNDNAKLSLSTISRIIWGQSYDALVYHTQQCAKDYNKTLIDNSNGSKDFAYEHFPLLSLVLYDETPNHYYFNYYMSFVENLLNIAPFNGPYRYIYDANGGDPKFDGHDYPIKEWATQMRLVKPIGVSLASGEEAGEYNGLDYMLLHNLYWLVYYNKFNQDKIVNETFPYSYTDVGGSVYSLGDQSNPITLYINSLNNIISSSTIKSNAKVVYRAGNSITLSAGFTLEPGASFTAIVDDHAGLIYQNTSLLKSKNITDFKYLDENPFNIKNLNKIGIGDSLGIVFKLFPNPTNGVFNIEYSSPTNEYSELKIFDPMGLVVQYQMILPGSHTIDIRQQPVGLYLIELKNKIFTKEYKIIKQ